MKKCCIIGAFGFSDMENATGGQPVKTRGLYNLLTDAFGVDKVAYVETYQWKKHPIRMLIQLLGNVFISDVVIVLPAQNGVVVFSKLLCRLKRKKVKIFYDVIGGWLPEKAAKDSALLENLKTFDGIWVETNSMKKALKDLGLENVTVIPNFKRINIVSREEIPNFVGEPYPLCTFSRVLEEKGIPDAIEAVLQINGNLGRTVFTLDIFGPVAPQYEATFFDQLKRCPKAICYKGVVSPSDSVQTVKDYFALLFPTRYYTEGVPGTIIDAYAAGVPVIASQWESFHDVIDHGTTGYGYAFEDRESLKNLLIQIAEKPKMIIELKENCMKKAEFYLPEKSEEVIVKAIV